MYQTPFYLVQFFVFGDANAPLHPTAYSIEDKGMLFFVLGRLLPLDAHRRDMPE